MVVAGSAFGEPVLRIGPVEGMSESWRGVPAEIELPVGARVELELSWGLNAADLNADGRVDLVDYATLSLCFSAPGGRRGPGNGGIGAWVTAGVQVVLSWRATSSRMVDEAATR